MNKDNHLMLEALQSKFTNRGPVNDIVVSELHKMHNNLNDMATMIDLNPSDEVDQLLSKIRDVADMLISDKPASQDDAEAIMKNKGAGQIQSGSEDAEGPMIQTYIHLDLYTGKTSVIPSEEFQEAIDGLEKVKGKMTVYKGEEYMVLVVPGK